MKKLFNSIRNSDIDTVKELLKEKPELLSCTAKQPPKKDDGQSPLQVALKTGNFEIAEYLLDLGADTNFMEIESCNDWKAPATHDAIRAAVMTSRRNFCTWDKSWKLHGTKEEADSSFNLLQKMFEKGADINAVDSKGNSCLARAILDARQILPSFIYAEQKVKEDKFLLVDEARDEDLSRIFHLLLQRGANIHEVCRSSEMPLSEFYTKEPVAKFFVK